jgi:hypothetical protein
MSELISVNVVVPPERVGEFHELFGHWCDVPPERRARLIELVRTFSASGSGADESTENEQWTPPGEALPSEETAERLV